MSSPAPAGRKPLQRNTLGRTLMRWNLDHDQELLLIIEFELQKQGVKFEWDAVGTHLHGRPTGEAIKQHLSKVRRNRSKAGLDNPPQWYKKRPRRYGQALLSPEPTVVGGIKREFTDEDQYENDMNNYEEIPEKAPRQKPEIGGYEYSTNMKDKTTLETASSKKRAKRAKALEENVKNASGKVTKTKKTTTTRSTMPVDEESVNVIDLDADGRYNYAWDMPIPSLANTTDHGDMNNTYLNTLAKTSDVGHSHSHPHMFGIPGPVPKSFDVGQMQSQLDGFDFAFLGNKNFGGDGHTLGHPSAFDIPYEGEMPAPPMGHSKYFDPTTAFSHSRFLPNSGSFLGGGSNERYPVSDSFMGEYAIDYSLHDKGMVSGNAGGYVDSGGIWNDAGAELGNFRPDATFMADQPMANDAAADLVGLITAPPAEVPLGDTAGDKFSADFKNYNVAYDTPYLPELFEDEGLAAGDSFEMKRADSVHG